MSGGWIDISVPVGAGSVHWPGDPNVLIERTRAIARGDAYNLTVIAMSLHTGTHIDAPLHFIEGAASMDDMPPDATTGPARVIEIRDPRAVRAAELEAHNPQPGERILFKTANSARCWKERDFVRDFVAVSLDAARLLAKRRVRAAGIDYLSIGLFDDPDETHRILLGAGVWVIEGLDLSAVEPGSYELVCLPLKVQGVEGAPARAMLRRA